MPQIVTHVFADGGRVVKVLRVDYGQYLGKPNLHHVLPKVMKVHHANVVNRVRQGEAFEDTLAGLRPDGNSGSPSSSGGRAVVASQPVGSADNVPSAESNRARKNRATPDAPPSRSSGSFTAAARAIWNRLVQEAQRERNAGDTDASPCATIPSETSYERPKGSRAVREESTGADADATLARLPDPAAEAYEMGLAQARTSNNTRALVCFARAVELDPHNARYRAALRRAIDWMD